MTSKNGWIELVLLLVTMIVFVLLVAICVGGCKVADRATIEATAKKQRIQLNEDLDMQLSSREGNIRSTVNSVLGMVLLVLAGQVGVVTVVVFAANQWQIRKLKEP